MTCLSESVLARVVRFDQRTSLFFGADREFMCSHIGKAKKKNVESTVSDKLSSWTVTSAMIGRVIVAFRAPASLLDVPKFDQRECFQTSCVVSLGFACAVNCCPGCESSPHVKDCRHALGYKIMFERPFLFVSLQWHEVRSLKSIENVVASFVASSILSQCGAKRIPQWSSTKHVICVRWFGMHLTTHLSFLWH